MNTVQFYFEKGLPHYVLSKNITVINPQEAAEWFNKSAKFSKHAHVLKQKLNSLPTWRGGQGGKETNK
ncbi:hypothetical protein PP175_21765 [Aneurinibacillus sp. Ricciae_BoGa-3]|uniref:hypothetical protein n=1 Tax=Aneurinibacillus sp. Ricciae_BoGa-3 TaxID=3022697 RepID=UPI0023416254|nr:hypothetical protein [Aneurinibacillus sp. Ricciae_BoGa-3]WCK53919.1 hypothetical protein PP175_21765 [Aneurinibacillus sp. Ricciae_BoGa-3]